jgi:hypothetical protein
MLRQLSLTFASVQERAVALDKCPDYECLSRKGARLEDFLNSSLNELGPTIEAADNDCLKHASQVALDSLRGYRELAVAAQDGDEKAMSDAALRGYEREVQAGEQLRSCGLTN